LRYQSTISFQINQKTPLSKYSDVIRSVQTFEEHKWPFSQRCYPLLNKYPVIKLSIVEALQTHQNILLGREVIIYTKNLSCVNLPPIRFVIGI
jgi:hypothetical protein